MRWRKLVNLEGLKFAFHFLKAWERNRKTKVDIVVKRISFRYLQKKIKAAIHTHYFDICDDWEPTDEKMLQMNEDAKKANITAIIGLF